MIKFLSNQDELIFGCTRPFGIVQREPFTAEVEDVTLGAFVEPENAFGTEDGGWELVIEELLELFDGEGAIALKRQRSKAIYL